MKEKKGQSGFTLVEIAMVLVIIGLLLAGILKGQELVNSARVRNLADQNSGIQAAYYGFIDRFRQVPGDFPSAEASTAIGTTINLPAAASATDGNGRIDNTYEEAAAVWEQLSKANFIQGNYNPATTPANDADYAANAPVNAFNGALTLTRNADYAGTASLRLALHLGPQIPVRIARELDVKIDDANPASGVLRLSAGPGADPFSALHAVSTAPPCVDAGGNYDIAGDAQDCGLVFLY